MQNQPPVFQQSPDSSSDPLFRFHLPSKKVILDEKRFHKSLLIHSRHSKSASYETKNNGQSGHQYLIQCQKVLQAQTKLSNLHFVLETSKQTENKLLLPTIRHSPSLSSLYLQFSDNFQEDIIPQEILLKNLGSLKNLNHLDLSFFFFMFHDTQLLKSIMKVIQKLRKISSLSLTFFNCYGLTSSYYNILLSNLTKITQLRSLKLDFDNSEDLVNSDIEIFASVLPKLAHLTQVDLIFEGDRTILEPTLVRLFKAFQSLKSLSDLSLNLRGCELTYLSDEGSILESLKCLIGSSISRLSLVLFRNFSNQNLRELYETLPEFTLLRNLSLYVSHGYGLIDEWIANFGSVLAGWTSLTSLSLYFPCQMTNKNIVQAIASAVKPLRNLVSLKLDLQFSHEIKDEHFQALFANLKHLKSLKYLDIQIADQKTVTDTSLEVLGESLKGLNLLRNLSLDFTRAGLLTNQGIEALCSAIQEGLSNLLSLSLKFERNENINEKAVSKLGEALQTLPLLGSVQLCFMLFWDVAGFKEIFTILTKLKYLEEIKLSLPYTEENCREVCALEKIKNIITVNYFTKSK